MLSVPLGCTVMLADGLCAKTRACLRVHEESYCHTHLDQQDAADEDAPLPRAAPFHERLERRPRDERAVARAADDAVVAALASLACVSARDARDRRTLASLACVTARDAGDPKWVLGPIPIGRS